MTDVIYLVLTLAAFVGLALLTGLLDRSDRTDQRATQQSDR